MTPGSLTAELKQEATRLGFELSGATPAVTPPAFGYFRQWLADGFAGEMQYLPDRADARRDPRRVLDGARSILMLATNYRSVEPAEAISGQGRISRYAWGTDYHEVIRRRLGRLAEFHRRLRPGAKVRGVVDTAPLLEREFARLAGLGWIGKNTCLVNRRFGSWLFLAALLSSEELEYDEPIEGSSCGSCRACLDACPTGALVEPYRLDARRCISYLTIELRGPIPAELRKALDERLFGCDLCQEACPHNRRTPSTSEAPFQAKAGMNTVNLIELLTLDDTAFAKRFSDTPLGRAKRRGILRNAAIVLGNRPHGAAVPTLVQGLSDHEPLVRAACAWALGQYETDVAKSALRERLEVETEVEVRAEIDAASRQ